MATTFESETTPLQDRLKEPQTVQALNKLLDQAENLHSLLASVETWQENISNFIAMTTDIMDEWARDLVDEGIDLETSFKQGLRAVLWLGQRVRQVELERLGILLRSDVLDEKALEAVGLAGAALAQCQQGTCELPTAEKVGLFGLLKALRDPQTQRALAFAVRFSKCFGSKLPDPAS